MPQSLANVALHIVFSTKQRRPYLQDDGLRQSLHSYLIGILRQRDCPALALNSVADHLHLLCQLSRTITIADLLKEVKGSSSHWLKSESTALQGFQWQGGYSVFSVSQSKISIVKQYIANQSEHHRKQSFQEELLGLLQRHQIQYNEEYLWD
jgi:putative transposase